MNATVVAAAVAAMRSLTVQHVRLLLLLRARARAQLCRCSSFAEHVVVFFFFLFFLSFFACVGSFLCVCFAGSLCSNGFWCVFFHFLYFPVSRQCSNGREYSSFYFVFLFFCFLHRTWNNGNGRQKVNDNNGSSQRKKRKAKLRACARTSCICKCVRIVYKWICVCSCMFNFWHLNSERSIFECAPNWLGRLVNSFEASPRVYSHAQSDDEYQNVVRLHSETRRKNATQHIRLIAVRVVRMWLMVYRS